MIPIIGMVLARRSAQTNALALFRAIHIRLATAPVLLVAVLALISGGQAEVQMSPAASAGWVIAFGLVCLALSERFGKRLSRATTREQVLGAYRTLYFLRFALSELPSIIALVLFFFNGTALWVNVVGLVITEIGLVRVAPTRTNLDRDQQLIKQTINLGRLLSESRPGQPGTR